MVIIITHIQQTLCLSREDKMGFTRKQLRGIFDQTRRISKENLRLVTEELKEWYTEVYTEEQLKSVFAKTVVVIGSKLPPISLIHTGTVETGYKLIEEKRSIAILNFADAITPGGLVLAGALTQEENICRCSNLYESLTIPYCYDNYYTPNAKLNDDIYTNNIIYSHNVTFFRDDKDYHIISPRSMDVITCPAPSRELEDEVALEIYIRRIEQILLAAIKNNISSLVLGAWGCGAFGQNPYLVAKAFAETLNKYGSNFEKIVFAIKPTTKGQEDINFKAFSEVLSEVYKGVVEIDG